MSPKLTPAAVTRIRTSPGPGTGAPVIRPARSADRADRSAMIVSLFIDRTIY
jgi:hypothetical protein